MTAALLAAKITGMVLGLLLALTVTGREHEK